MIDQAQMRMRMRQISGLELVQLRREYRQLTNWQEAKTIADRWWGPKAAKLAVDSEGEYNDEGGTNYRVRRMRAYDADGEILDYDYSLPAWQERLANPQWKDYFLEREEVEEYVEQHGREEIRTRIKRTTGEKYFDDEYDYRWFFDNECDVMKEVVGEMDGTTEFDLTQPPKALPQIFVMEQVS